MSLPFCQGQPLQSGIAIFTFMVVHHHTRHVAQGVLHPGCILLNLISLSPGLLQFLPQPVIFFDQA